MIVAGVDPGLNITGYSILDYTKNNVVLIEAGCIKTDRQKKLEERIKTIYLEYKKIIEKFKPSVISIEELYSNYKFPKTAIIMGHARAMIFLLAGLNNIEIVGYAATKVKSSLTGNGHSSKEQIQKMIKLKFKLEKVPEPPDVSDAIAIALCHCNNMFDKNIKHGIF